MPRGIWMRWLEENAETLGFKHRAARMLMKAALKWQSTAILDDNDARSLSRKIWGNAQPHPKEPKPPRVAFSEPMTRAEQQRLIDGLEARVAEQDEEIANLRRADEIAAADAHSDGQADCRAQVLIAALKLAVSAAITLGDWEPICEQHKQEIDELIDELRDALHELMQMRLSKLEQRQPTIRALKSGDHQVGRSGQPGAGA